MEHEQAGNTVSNEHDAAIEQARNYLLPEAIQKLWSKEIMNSLTLAPLLRFEYSSNEEYEAAVAKLQADRALANKMRPAKEPTWRKMFRLKRRPYDDAVRAATITEYTAEWWSAVTAVASVVAQHARGNITSTEIREFAAGEYGTGEDW